MNIRDYAAKVAEVRDLQRRFFRGDKSIVGQAMQKEKELDRLTRDILDDRPSLFPEPEASTPRARS